MELKDAEELSPFAITTRYPIDDEPVSKAEAKRAIDIAAQVRVVIGAVLIAEGLDV